MSTNYAQGVYKIKNPQKYIGKGDPKFRSSWEFYFMNFLDTHPSVLQWASEAVRILYRHPLTGKITNYVPDFIIVVVGKDGKNRAELIEIKPRKEAVLECAKSTRDQAMLLINQAKWAAAAAWAVKNGMTFRVLTEAQLFHQGAKKQKPPRA